MCIVDQSQFVMANQNHSYLIHPISQFTLVLQLFTREIIGSKKYNKWHIHESIMNRVVVGETKNHLSLAIRLLPIWFRFSGHRGNN